MCSFTFSVPLMIGETQSTRELPLLYPMNAIKENDSASGHTLAQRWGCGETGRGVGGVE